MFPDAVRASCTADQVAHLLELVPRAQLLVLQHERCHERTEDELRRTFEFLDLDPGAPIRELDRPVNSRVRRLPPIDEGERRRTAAYFEDQARRLCELLPEIDPDRWPSLSEPARGPLR
jgi:hypothetical protein